MMPFKEYIQIQTMAGSPVSVGNIVVTPQSQAVIVRLPIGGFVWHRPTAILIEREGQTQRMVIKDDTRRLQFCLLGLGLALSIVGIGRFLSRKDLQL